MYTTPLTYNQTNIYILVNKLVKFGLYYMNCVALNYHMSKIELTLQQEGIEINIS